MLVCPLFKIHIVHKESNVVSYILHKRELRYLHSQFFPQFVASRVKISYSPYETFRGGMGNLKPYIREGMESLSWQHCLPQLCVYLVLLYALVIDKKR